MSPRSPRWLVLGAKGKLGTSARELAERHGVDAVGCEERIGKKSELDRLLRSEKPDVVLNCAAFTDVDACETERAAAVEANSIGPGSLAEVCRGRALLVHMSTEYVFDGTTSRPIREDAPTGPLNTYGETKLAGEIAVANGGGEHLIVRTQWLFGPGPNFVDTILRAARKNPELRVVDDQLGRPTWTGALAPALFAAVAAEVRGTLHLASEGVASWYDLAIAIVREGAARRLNPIVPVIPVSTAEMKRPAERPAFGVLDLERARSFGILMPHWRDALVAYLDMRVARNDA